MTDIDGRLWHYRARILRTVDGDTFDAVLDLGFGQQTFEPPNPTRPHPLATRIRLAGVDTPEKKTHTIAAGRAAQAALNWWVTAHQNLWTADAWHFVVRTGYQRHLDRWVGELYSRYDGTTAAEFLVETGHARLSTWT